MNAKEFISGNTEGVKLKINHPRKPEKTKSGDLSQSEMHWEGEGEVE